MMEDKINKHYVWLLKRNRTTIVDLLKLWLSKEISFKKFISIVKKPVEIYVGEDLEEELLSTRLGLKMIGNNNFLTYKNKLVKSN